MTSTARNVQVRPRATVPRRTPIWRVTPEARWVWLAILLFIAMSVWWLTQDDRMPDWDSGLHELYGAVVHSELITPGQFWRPFTDFNLAYPPLVHFVGGLTIFVTGVHPMALILSSNLVFVPVLAFGCFGTGRYAYGSRAGLLAALLALGSPMFVSMMHEYDLDPPEAAMVAVSVWALLESRRFERVWVSALAGLLTGLALMVKETAVVFLAGFVAVTVLRAGPHRWRGMVTYLAVAAVVAGPWYVYHWHDIIGSFNAIGGLAPNSVQAPPRYSLRNVSWYWWNLVNEQVLTPFGIFFLIGVGLALWRIVRGRLTRENVEPELLAGVVVSYVGMTYLTHKDPRYTLPMLIYVAVLGTGWIANLSDRRARIALSTAVIALSAVYFVGLSAGIGGAVRVPLPGAQNNIIYSRQLTLYETNGWVRGGPVHDANVQALLAGLPALGVKGVIPEVGTGPIDFNPYGLEDLALDTGIVYGNSLPPSQEAYLILLQTDAAAPPACQTMNDGSRIYVVRLPAPGFDVNTLTNPANPHQTYTFVCPGKRPETYP